MIKSSLFILLIITLLGCELETNSNRNNSKETKIVETKQILPQFENVEEMLLDASDYYEENGSLKFISEDESNLHIQVSKSIFKGDSESVKKDIVKRDIVYVAFQTFAQTNIKELTITAIPKDWKNHKKYYNEYKKTLKVNRTKAKVILKKYLNSSDFSILYKKRQGIWLPNKKFDELKFEKLEEVFIELLK